MVPRSTCCVACCFAGSTKNKVVRQAQIGKEFQATTVSFLSSLYLKHSAWLRFPINAKFNLFRSFGAVRQSCAETLGFTVSTGTQKLNEGCDFFWLLVKKLCFRG